jgi:transcriptional regulator with XRE-family HTH domain
MYFEDLLQRVAGAITTRMREAGLSERRLAAITGISQPHIHNVLKGKRILSPSAADQILRCLDLDLTALAGGPGSATGGAAPACVQAALVEVPVLDGWLGPSLPLPTVASADERYPFPASFVAGLDRPAVARLAADPRLDGELREHDLVLLDHSPEVRRAPDRRGV